jgi:hypothetical protein
MIDHTELLRRLHYDPATGIFTWLTAGPRGSNIKVGASAGSVDIATGYWRVGIGTRLYKRHQLAWFYVSGAWPDLWVDHENGIPGDDWLGNLRLVTKSQSSMNRAKRKGAIFKGVCLHHGRWEATMGKRGSVYLGSFPTAEDAAKAYDRAAIATYGAYARLNFPRETTP